MLTSNTCYIANILLKVQRGKVIPQDMAVWSQANPYNLDELEDVELSCGFITSKVEEWRMGETTKDHHFVRSQ